MKKNRKRNIFGIRKQRIRNHFPASCAAFGFTKGFWIAIFKTVVSKRRIRRQYGKARTKLKIIRQEMKIEELLDGQ